MASKFFRAFNFFKKKGTVAPTITQPRQLPGTMKKIRSQYKKFGFEKAKRKEGIKGSKEVKKMVDTGQATRVGGQVFHKSVREKKAMGGVTGAIDKLKKKKESAPKKDSIKDKILDPKKKKRLEELRKELGMKKGGRAKKKFPDLTGDGKVTQADILKGRGVFRKGGASK